MSCANTKIPEFYFFFFFYSPPHGELGQTMMTTTYSVVCVGKGPKEDSDTSESLSKKNNGDRGKQRRLTSSKTLPTFAEMSSMGTEESCSFSFSVISISGCWSAILINPKVCDDDVRSF